MKSWSPTSIQTHKWSSWLTKWRPSMKVSILKYRTLWSYAPGCVSETWFQKLCMSSIEWKTFAGSSPHVILNCTTSTFLVRNHWTKSCTRSSIRMTWSLTRKTESSRAPTQFIRKLNLCLHKNSYLALRAVYLKIVCIQRREQGQFATLNLTKSWCFSLIQLKNRPEEDFIRIRNGQAANLRESYEALNWTSSTTSRDLLQNREMGVLSHLSNSKA